MKMKMKMKMKKMKMKMKLKVKVKVNIGRINDCIILIIRVCEYLGKGEVTYQQSLFFFLCRVVLLLYLHFFSASGWLWIGRLSLDGVTSIAGVCVCWSLCSSLDLVVWSHDALRREDARAHGLRCAWHTHGELI